MSRFVRVVLAVVGLLVLALPGRADLDPGAGEPYQVEVVLSLGEHRLLTDVFREQIERELSDGLQAGAGEMANVKVLSEHPKLAEVRRRGLGETLRDWKEVTGVKTHFVLIDYVEGQYEIVSQQHDGLTGQPSPVVRRQRTSDRQFVARLATLHIAQDFGPVATVLDHSNPDNVKVQFRAARRGNLERWLSKGELLLVTRLEERGEGRERRLVTSRVSDAVLQLENKDDKEEGVWYGRLHYRYEPAIRGGGAGVRCLRIATVKGPLALRVVSTEGKTAPAVGLGVQVRKHGFKDDRDKAERATDREGYVQLPGPYDRLAFVTIKSEPMALVPVPLVDDRPVTVGVTLRQTRGSLLAYRRQIWEQQVSESYAVQTALFKELKGLNEKEELREQALERARKGLADSEQALKTLQSAMQRLIDDARKASEPIDVGYGEQFLGRLEKGNKELEDYVTAQEKIVKEEIPKQKALQEKVQQGKAAEALAEFDQALEIYAKALAEGLKDDGVRKRHDDLKARWATKGPAHEAARQYIYKSWPGIEIDKLKEALPEAKKALKSCREAQDRLTPQKFLLVAVALPAKIKEAIDGLRPDEEEDQKKHMELLAVSKELQQLITEAQKDAQAGGM